MFDFIAFVKYKFILFIFRIYFVEEEKNKKKIKKKLETIISGCLLFNLIFMYNCVYFINILQTLLLLLQFRSCNFMCLFLVNMNLSSQ